jgi:hypothetical protein
MIFLIQVLYRKGLEECGDLGSCLEGNRSLHCPGIPIPKELSTESPAGSQSLPDC